MKKITAIAIALAALAIGCGPNFEMMPQPGFVEIEQEWDHYDYRAATPDGLVIAAREIEHDPKADASVWLKAIEGRLREGKGYALLERVEVKSADGVSGTQLRFGHDDDTTPFLYYLTVFVTDDYIVLVEAGGEKELMTKSAATVASAVSTFRVN
ncbi:MAG: serine/threonine protein kinase [Polyangiaceae bacterium]